MNENTSQTATIDCPRCQGAGSRPEVWNPDAGICYRCHGRAKVSVNIPRHSAALRHLRAKYRRLQAEVKAAQTADEREWAKENLNRVTADGIRLRAELDEAQASL